MFAKETGDTSEKIFRTRQKPISVPSCQGNGVVSTSLDVAAKHIEICDVCKGKRYQKATLAYTIEGKHIADVLAMNVTELLDWISPYAGTANAVQQLQVFKQCRSISSASRSDGKITFFRRKATIVVAQLAAKQSKRSTIDIWMNPV